MWGGGSQMGCFDVCAVQWSLISQEQLCQLSLLFRFPVVAQNKMYLNSASLLNS